MIVVTGALGFIGSCLASVLAKERSATQLVLVDDFSKEYKFQNIKDLAGAKRIDRNQLVSWMEAYGSEVEMIYHLGARTDTAEMDEKLFLVLNLNYSKTVWNLATQFNIPLVYASSAATYGNGKLGFSDDPKLIPNFTPLNPYGDSKQAFDLWATTQEQTPPKWFGFKFFNVYGPNEYHKGRMASVVYHCYNQIQQTGAMRLFRSHKEEFADGEQSRDFIYVKDVVRILKEIVASPAPSGIYNLGTGMARTFNDLVAQTFKSLALQPDISYIDTPEDIRDSYQYYTQADMKQLQSHLNFKFHSLEDGVDDYVSNYLQKESFI